MRIRDSCYILEVDLILINLNGSQHKRVLHGRRFLTVSVNMKSSRCLCGCMSLQNIMLPLGGSDDDGICWTAEGVAQW